MLLESQLIEKIVANEIYHIGWENTESTELLNITIDKYLKLKTKINAIENGFSVSYINPTNDKSIVSLNFIFRKSGNEFTTNEEILDVL